jgi:hypothetical protein
MSTVPPNPPYPPGTPTHQSVAAGQPVVVTPAPAPQQVVPPAPAPEQEKQVLREEARQREPKPVIIISHSNFFYWWPVWVCGYIMAAITRIWGDPIQIGGHAEWFHPSKDLGVIFTLTCFLVILVTNVTVRGLSSVVVILGVVLAVVLALYFGWWEQLATWFNMISIHMNMGFYVCFSTLIFVVWFIAVFFYDRLSYWRVTPGQITHDYVIGGSAKSYDTRGMVFEKHRNDLFRHWILGIGSGDIQISTMGAKRETIAVPNVLFVDAKVAAIQKLIAMQPDEFAAPPA